MSRKITVRFNEEEQKIIDLYMEFQSKPFSAVLKETLMEDIADFFGSCLSEELIEFNKKHPTRYTSKQLLKELGME